MNTDRRRFLGVLAGVAVGGAGASAFARTGRADAGATLTASDVTVRTHDGALGALTVAPAGTVSWSGLEDPAGSVELALYAKLDSALRYRELAGQRLDAAGLHGETEFRFETRDLLDGPGFSSADFTPDDGERRTRTVRLRLGITVYGTDEAVLTTGYADVTFDVTVENRPEQGGVNGRANTGGEPANGGETQATETTTTEGTTTTTTEGTTTTTTEETTTATGTTEDEPTAKTTENDEKNDGNEKKVEGNKYNYEGNNNNSEVNKNNVRERSDRVASLASASEE